MLLEVPPSPPPQTRQRLISSTLKKIHTVVSIPPKIHRTLPNIRLAIDIGIRHEDLGNNFNRSRRHTNLYDSSVSEDQPTSMHKRRRSIDVQRKHEIFWFRGGDVILRVENWLFRVLSSLLESKSPYFEELFSARGADASRPVIDGCKIFDLRGRKCHFTALLDALFGSM